MIFRALPAILTLLGLWMCGVAVGSGRAQLNAGQPAVVGNPRNGAVLPPPPAGFTLQPMNVQPPSPQLLEMIKLEEQFALDVEKGGGPAFARWFTDDGVTLNNGQPPVVGRAAILRVATWKPTEYKLTWFVEGAGMSDAKDAAYTWGHYDTETPPARPGEQPTVRGGRYITFWKKVDGHWKVSLEASAAEPAGGSALPTGNPGSPAGAVQNEPRNQK